MSAGFPAGAIVGRVDELATLETFLEATRAGFGVLVIDGEAGIGKTTIWQEGVQLARASGATVVVARATEAETGLSYAGLADLFDAIPPPVIDQLPSPQRESLSAALLRAPAPAGGIDQRALFASVLSVLRITAADHQVVVAIDDAQWLDVSSTRALAFALRRLDAEAVRVLLTVRRLGSTTANWGDGVDTTRKTTISLGALSVGALHELIKRRTGRSLNRPAIVQIARLCEGNPFHALEVARELGDQVDASAILHSPPSVGELLAARMKRMPEDTRRALLVAAMLARPTTESLDRDALVPAEQEGIVVVEGGVVRFVHPLFASSVYDLAEVAERRSIHRSLAARMTDLEERARHSALGSEGPSRSVAALLDAGAKHAAARGAPQAAAYLVDLALEMTPPFDNRRMTRRMVEATRFLFAAGDLEGAQKMLERALTTEPAGPLRAQVLQLLGRLRARVSSFDDARDAATDALTEAGDNPELRSGIELDLAYYCVCTGEFPRSEVHARAAVERAEGPPPLPVFAHALGVQTMTEFLCGRGLDEPRMARALALEEGSSVRIWQMRPTFIWGLLALWTGRIGDALQALGALAEENRDRGEESPIPVLSHYLTWANLWRGDLHGAQRVAEGARDMAALLGDPAALGGAHTACALVYAHEGSVDLARSAAREAIVRFEQIGWRTGTIWPLWAIGMAELCAGNPVAVDAALGPLGDTVRNSGAGDPVLGVFVPDEIEALVEMGQVERAEALLHWFEERATVLDRAWARAMTGRCKGLLDAARDRYERAVEALEEALVQHDRAGIPLDQARTLLVLGRILRRAGRRARAKAALEEAQKLFETVGAQGWERRARDELRRLGQRTSAPDALTATERQVAELAASGLSNKEVAERAFVSVKGVEANLTRVYRKLGIHSRSGLARALTGNAHDPEK